MGVAVRTSHLLDLDVQVVLVVVLLPLPLLLLVLLLLLQLLSVLDEDVREAFRSRVVVLSEVLFEVPDPLEVVVVVVPGANGTILEQLLGVLLVFSNYRV